MATSSSEDSHEDALDFGKPLWYRRLPILGLGGLLITLVLLVCSSELLSAMFPWTLFQAKRIDMSAAELLEGRRLAEVVAGNLAAVARLSNEGGIDVEAITPEVQEGLRRVSGSIWERSPEMHRRLQEFQLSPDQQDGLLALMARTRDSRVQDLGRSLARVVQQLDASEDSDGIGDHIFAKLSPRLRELLQLRGEIVPLALRQTEDSASAWSATLDPEKMQIVRSYKKWRMEVEMTPPARGADEPWRRLLGGMESVSWDAIESQGAMFLGRAQAYMSSFPKVYDVVFSDQYFQTFKACAHKSFSNMDAKGLFTCWTTYASAALEALESVVDKKAATNAKRWGYAKSPAPVPVHREAPQRQAAPKWEPVPVPAPRPGSRTESEGLPGFNVFG